MAIDWIIHYVTNHYTCEVCGKKPEESPIHFPGFANIHTHGLERYGQKELCLCLDLGMEVAKNLLNTLGMRVAKGETIFTEGIRTDILSPNPETGKEYDVQLISFDGDDNIYIILPDENGKLPMDGDECDMPYRYQEIYADIISKDKKRI